MGEPTLQFESSNIQNILIALVVICAIVYGFIEFRKINIRLQELETKLLKVDNSELPEGITGFKFSIFWKSGDCISCS